MANITFPDGSAPLFNPAAYGEASAEARKTGAGKTGRNKKSGVVKKKGFASFFEKAVLGAVKELPLSEDSFHELMDGVHSTGDALSKRPFPPEIKAYKEAVRNFVHYVVENTFDTEEAEGIPNYMRPSYKGGHNTPLAKDRKKFTLVQVIDEKLEAMAAAILRGQLNQLAILDRLDEIKGLLIDLKQ
jgi:uncharacterized protein YaaR (DUF327 family)